MDDSTAARLNAINQQFYRVTAAEFDRTRGQPWPGWVQLWEHLPIPAPEGVFSALDVGCGNGRLGVFLAEQLPVGVTLDYHGLDTDPALLARAAEALNREGIAARLEQRIQLERRDIITHPPESGAYDLVALFGVLHHIPGAARRRALVRALAERVAPGGVLAFACWRFYEYARFRARIVPWPDDLAARVEPGDHLLDWRRGERALRYCHHVDDAEQAGLVAAAEAAGVSLLAQYRADGRTNDANAYAILRRA
ncbi:MAG: class I SAM-dependent methyltransferase [Anaerolineae bacterium]|nr:class I SAM-dependent methyltransferase [Anaerolineae bacterium]